MIDAQIVEELFLDYKQSSTTLPGKKLGQNDQKNLSKAIGGFANSEGGVIVWGVDCRQTPDGDVPTKAVPITQPIALKTLFDTALGGLTLPAHSTVENISLLDGSSSHGFVVTYVPTGLHVPYQSLYPDPPEYYIRVGSTFRPTPHGVLAGLFGRAPQANVVPIVSLKRAGYRTGALRVSFDVLATNKGRGFAENVFFLLETKLPSNLKVVLTPAENDADAWRTGGRISQRASFVTPALVAPMACGSPGPGAAAPATALPSDNHQTHLRLSERVPLEGKPRRGATNHLHMMQSCPVGLRPTPTWTSPPSSALQVVERLHRCRTSVSTQMWLTF
jgi:hypothetical protein